MSRAEVEALRSENKRLREGVRGDFGLDAWLDWSAEAEKIRAEVEALCTAAEVSAADANDAEREAEALRKDAERYRWLRKRTMSTPVTDAKVAGPFICAGTIMTGFAVPKEPNGLIDAAMAAKEGRP